MTHCRGDPKLNFNKCMIRALEDDFKKVVGIRWYLWVFVILFLLLNIKGWHTYFWIAFVPLILLITVGTKLEHVISQLAIEIAEKHIAVEGELVVQPSDNHFWFRRPHIVLFFIHFILFQNAFEIAFFFGVLLQYGFRSCLMDKVGYTVSRLVIGVFIQVICSYSTLPLYALVTQASLCLLLDNYTCNFKNMHCTIISKIFVSEDMVKYMCNIYYKLSKPSLANPSLSSPTSSLSCSSGFSPEDHCDNWSPGIRKVSSFDLRLDNPFHIEGLKDFSGPYSSMVESWVADCLVLDSGLGCYFLQRQNSKLATSDMGSKELSPFSTSHSRQEAIQIPRVELLLKMEVKKSTNQNMDHIGL